MKDIYYTNSILNIIKTKVNKMNPNNEINDIRNNNIVENIINNLDPLPLFQRNNTTEYFGMEELIADADFQEFQCYDTPNDLVMPMPCPRCYWVCCNGDCSNEEDNMSLSPKNLSFEEKMNLLPPPTRMTTNTDLPPDQPQDEAFPIPVPRFLPRQFTNADLLAKNEKEKPEHKEKPDK